VGIGGPVHRGCASAQYNEPVLTTHWYLRDSNSLEMGADGEANMEVDSSIPWDEVKVGPRPSFGPLSNTTLDPWFAYQPLPYSQGVEVDRVVLLPSMVWNSRKIR